MPDRLAEKERTDAVRERILAKFEELSIKPDHDRLEQEMIFYLEKLDINEECVRLRPYGNTKARHYDEGRA